MEKRMGLFIGNELFDNTHDFSALSRPVKDAKDFANVLSENGEFTKKVLENENASQIREKIEEFFCQANLGDILLFYYSGHGFIDNVGSYFFAAKDSKIKLPESTAIPEEFLKSVIRKSKAKHKVVILDCCFSGSFSKDQKGNNRPLSLKKLTGETYAVLTSSDSVTPSYEGTNSNSLFTHYLCEGIITGQADTNQDGKIDVEELFQYSERRLREVKAEQTPTFLWKSRGSKITIARNSTSRVREKNVDIAETKATIPGVVFGQKRVELVNGFNTLEEFVSRYLIELVSNQELLISLEREIGEKEEKNKITQSKSDLIYAELQNLDEVINTLQEKVDKRYLYKNSEYLYQEDFNQLRKLSEAKDRLEEEKETLYYFDLDLLSKKLNNIRMALLKNNNENIATLQNVYATLETIVTRSGFSSSKHWELIRSYFPYPFPLNIIYVDYQKNMQEYEEKMTIFRQEVEAYNIAKNARWLKFEEENKKRWFFARFLKIRNYEKTEAENYPYPKQPELPKPDYSRFSFLLLKEIGLMTSLNNDLMRLIHSIQAWEIFD